MKRMIHMLLVCCIVGCAHTPRSPLNPEQMSKKEDAYLQFVQGSLLAMEGSPDKAVKELENLLRRFPDNAFFFQLYAEWLARAGQEAEALTAARRSVEINPQSIDARILLGKLLMNVDPQEAARVLERVVADAPDREEVYSLLAKLFVDQGRPRQGIDAMRRLLKVNPDAVVAYLNMGSIYEKQLKSTTSALSMYREAIRLEPDHLMAHNAMAQLYLDRKDVRNALATYREIEKLTPSDVSVSLRIALLYYELKEYTNAVEKFTTILAHHPQADKIRFYLGMLYEGIGQKTQAMEQFGLIPPSSDSYQDARIHIAEIYESQKKYQEAIAAIVTAIKHFPNEEGLALFLGFLYEKIRDREHALETMQRVLKINPQNASALNYIGYTYAERGERLDEASHLLEEAVKIRPDDGYIIDSLGWLRFRQGHLDEASALLEKALRLSPKEPTILYHLGEVRAHQGKSKEALRLFRQSLDAWKKRPEPDEDEMSRVQQRLDELSEK